MRHRMFFSVLLFLQTACGTWGGNPPKDLRAPVPTPEQKTALVDLELTTSGTSDVEIKTADGQTLGRIRLTSHRHIFKDFSFYKDQKPSSPQFEGAYLFDLISGKIEPSTKSASVATGSYTHVAFRMANSTKGQFPSLGDDDRLIGHASHIKGSIEFMGQTMAFDHVFAAPAQEVNFQGQLPTGATNEVLSIDGQRLVIGFHVDKWFTVDNLAVLIDQNAFLQQMLKGLEQTSSLQVKN